MAKIDCFFTAAYKGGFIHQRCVNNVPEYEYQINGKVRPAKSWRAAQILISRAQQS